MLLCVTALVEAAVPVLWLNGDVAEVSLILITHRTTKPADFDDIRLLSGMY